MIGLVSRADVVCAPAVPDEELEEAMRGVLARLPLELRDVEFEVSGGRSVCAARFRRAAWRSSSPSEVARLSGVRSVLPQLCWPAEGPAAPVGLGL
jgi:hypothetical protein